MSAFKYNRCCRTNDDHYITKVVFNISRYGKNVSSLSFPKKQTEDYAITQVEAYLSQPITRSYFDTIKGDLFNRDLKFEDLVKYDYHCRGDLLTDSVFLNRIERITESTIAFRCDS